MQPMIHAADLHCDTADLISKGYSLGKKHRRHHIDLPRMKDGGVALQVFACFIRPNEAGTYYARAVSMLDSLKHEIGTHPEQIQPCLSRSDLAKADRIAAVFGFEGGHHLDGSIERLNDLFDRGVRVCTITWNNSNFLAASCCDKDQDKSGLTPAGRSAIKLMNRLGMAVDLSHAGERTFWDTLNFAEKPPFASHSCARALCHHRRNLSDDQAKALSRAGGIVGVCFYRKFLRNGLWFLANIGDVCRHILHLREVAGPDHVALGSDFDGMALPARGIPNVSFLPVLACELARRGLPQDEIRKIWFENAANYFGRVLPV